MQYFASEYDRKYAEYEKYQADHKQINTTAGKIDFSLKCKNGEANHNSESNTDCNQKSVRLVSSADCSDQKRLKDCKCAQKNQIDRMFTCNTLAASQYDHDDKSARHKQIQNPDILIEKTF